MNLLPIKEKEDLKKGLRLRFVIVALLLLMISFLIGTIMILPSYFLALSNLSKTELIDYSLKAENENLAKEIIDLPNEINSKLKFVQSNEANISSISVLSEIINSIPEKVTLDSISFSRNKNYKEKNGVLVLISGIAVDRNSLVSFSNILRESKSFSQVDIPVSSLTKDKNLPFSINILIQNQNE